MSGASTPSKNAIRARAAKTPKGENGCWASSTTTPRSEKEAPDQPRRPRRRRTGASRARLPSRRPCLLVQLARRGAGRRQQRRHRTHPAVISTKRTASSPVKSLSGRTRSSGRSRRRAVRASSGAPGVKLISEMMTSAGLTSVHDASCSTDSAVAYQDAYHNDELRMRVYMLVRGEMFEGCKTAGNLHGLRRRNASRSAASSSGRTARRRAAQWR